MTPIEGSAFLDVDLPDKASDIEGMVTEAEQRLLYKLTSEHWQGLGAVVEIGSYKGRSSFALASGMAHSETSGDLHCYDDFGLLGGPHSLKNFRKNLTAFENVIAHQGRMEHATWDGGAIEILFLDAPKKIVSLTSVFVEFAPHLIPGASLVVFQDYLHPLSYAIPAAVFSLGDRLQVKYVVTPGATVVFNLVDSIDLKDSLPWNWDFRIWTVREAISAWDKIADTYSGAAMKRVQLQLPFLLDEMGEHRAATAAVDGLLLDDAQIQKLLKMWSSLSNSRPRLMQAFRKKLLADGLPDGHGLQSVAIGNANPSDGQSSPIRRHLKKCVKRVLAKSRNFVGK